MTTALVTGAAGFIGSHVARHLLDQGMAVTALDDLSGGARDNVPAGAAWVQQVGSRKTQDFAHIEVPIGLPAGW
jgi:nucleoside-diphosphate-sugar epimerase